MADYFHAKQIPFGFNQFFETKDRRREDFDLYTGQPDEAILKSDDPTFRPSVLFPSGRPYERHRSLRGPGYTNRFIRAHIE